jgi:ribosomal protein S14
MQPNTKKGRRLLRSEKIVSQNTCYNCGVPDGLYINRGQINGVNIYSDNNGYVYNADFITTASTAAVIGHYSKLEAINNKEKTIKVKLFLTYLDNDTTNESPVNTRLLCQRCYKRFTAVVRGLKRQLKDKADKIHVRGVEDSNPLQMELDFIFVDGPTVTLPGVIKTENNFIHG